MVIKKGIKRSLSTSILTTMHRDLTIFSEDLVNEVKATTHQKMVLQTPMISQMLHLIKVLQNAVSVVAPGTILALLQVSRPHDVVIANYLSTMVVVLIQRKRLDQRPFVQDIALNVEADITQTVTVQNRNKKELT